MRVRNHGFALIIVLIAVVGVFALAMHGAVMSRSATIEARVVRERMEGERAARSAAMIVLLSLTGNDFSGPPGSAGASGSFQQPGVPGGPGGARGPGGAGAEAEEKPEIELPPIIREMIGSVADDLQNQAREEISKQGGATSSRSADGGGITGRISRQDRTINETGVLLPGVAISVPIGFTASGDSDLICTVHLSDASGGLNLNTASEDEIARYIAMKASDPLLALSLTDELLDWRDEDDFARPRGAERATYEQLGITPRNGPIVSREELLFLPSMTREIFESVRNDIAIDGDGMVHAGSASRDVLAALPGMTLDVADAIILLRTEGKLTEETLEQALPLFAREAKERLRVRPSTVLRVLVKVRRASENTVMEFEGLAVASGRGVRALGLKPR